MQLEKGHGPNPLHLKCFPRERKDIKMGLGKKYLAKVLAGHPVLVTETSESVGLAWMVLCSVVYGTFYLSATVLTGLFRASVFSVAKYGQ